MTPPPDFRGYRVMTLPGDGVGPEIVAAARRVLDAAGQKYGFLLAYEAATGNRAYLDFMIEKWWMTTAYLYDPSEHLFFRDSTYFKRTESNGRKVFWSRGNGWVLAGCEISRLVNPP